MPRRSIIKTPPATTVADALAATKPKAKPRKETLAPALPPEAYPPTAKTTTFTKPAPEETPQETSVPSLESYLNPIFTRAFETRRQLPAERTAAILAALKERGIGHLPSSTIPNVRFDFGLLRKDGLDEWLNHALRYRLPMMVVPISTHLYPELPKGAAMASYPVLDASSFLRMAKATSPENVTSFLARFPLREHEDIGAVYFSVTDAPSVRDVLRPRGVVEPETKRLTLPHTSLSDVQVIDFLETVNPSSIHYVNMSPYSGKIKIGKRYTPPVTEKPTPSQKAPVVPESEAR